MLATYEYMKFYIHVTYIVICRVLTSDQGDIQSEHTEQMQTLVINLGYIDWEQEKAGVSSQ